MEKRWREFGALALTAGCALALALGAAGAAGKATISAADNAKLGTIVVGSTGRTVYHYLAEHGKTVACTGACAKQWPPVLVGKSAKPAAGVGITASRLGTITRPDGTVQVTYNGFPLYRFAGDTKNGQVNGQGLENLWYALAASGAIVKISPTAAASSGGGSSTSTSPSTSTSAGGYGSGY